MHRRSQERGEALTGVRAGRVSSRERQLLWGADAVGGCGRPHPGRRYREALRDPARSKTRVFLGPDTPAVSDGAGGHPTAGSAGRGEVAAPECGADATPSAWPEVWSGGGGSVSGQDLPGAWFLAEQAGASRSKPEQAGASRSKPEQAGASRSKPEQDALQLTGGYGGLCHHTSSASASVASVRVPSRHYTHTPRNRQAREVARAIVQARRVTRVPPTAP